MLMTPIVLVLMILSCKFPWWRRHYKLSAPRLLMYHRVEPSQKRWGEKWAIAPRHFEFQLRCLSWLGWTSNTVSELLDAEERMPKQFALTFDDGFTCFISHVLPLLKRYQVKATLFCVTDQSSNAWDCPHEGKKLLLDDAAIKTIIDSGLVEIASHGRWHQNLTQLSDAALHDELSQSKALLESRYSITIRGFAYPFGQRNDRVKKAVKSAGYDYALSVKNKTDCEYDCFDWPRLTMDGRFWRRLDFFSQILKGQRGWL